MAPPKLVDSLEKFLKSFRDEHGNLKYRGRISEIISEGGRSLLTDFDDILSTSDEVATMLRNEPDVVLPAFNDAAYETLKPESPVYAESIRRELVVRVRGLPTIPIRSVSTKFLNKLISLTGMVVRTSELKPLAVEAAFRCENGDLTREPQNGPHLVKPQRCPICQSPNLELVDKESRFVDYQMLRFQELPEELPPGQLPQSYDISITGDIVGKIAPGDRVNVTGTVRSEPEYSSTGRRRLRTFALSIEGNYAQSLGKEPETLKISKEDEDMIKKIASQENAYERLIRSVAPAIHGYETQKEAILLLAAGAPQRVLQDGTAIRGDINVLFVGDPGTAKSELLKYAARIAPRGLYTSGRGTTAAGLTAAVVREKSGMMMLEAGAVVLADQGVACIDEFDKMRPEDRNALHECMEQQTVSVAKGGIVATLNARTSILSALNPLLGKYDPYSNLMENINLPVALLTRFDLIFVIRDIPDRAQDERLARFILEQHRKGEYAVTPPIDFETLRKYFIYCKNLTPILTKPAEEKITEFYLQMRSTATEGQITVTPRQLEALIRLAAARARLLLRLKIVEDDALAAVTLMRRMLESPVATDTKTGRVDLGVIYGRPLSEKDQLVTALETFKALEGARKNPVDGKVFVEELVKTKKFTEDEARRMLNMLNRTGQIYEVKPGQYRKL
jgi:replicative DNA helicase Mcm